MDGYRAAAADSLTVIPALSPPSFPLSPPVIPALSHPVIPAFSHPVIPAFSHPVIPAFSHPVISAKAGIQNAGGRLRRARAVAMI